MPRKSTPPKYRLHKQSGQAIVTLVGGTRRRDMLLGEHGTAANRAKCAALVAESEAGGRRLGNGDPSWRSVNELLLAFWKWAEGHYRGPDGEPSTELRDYKPTLRPLRELFGTLPAAEFSPLKLKAVRDRMVAAGLSRGVVNQRIRRIVRVFKWGVAEELVAETTWQALKAVPGLERGRSAARETAPVQPVADAAVEAVLPFLTGPVQATPRRSCQPPPRTKVPAATPGGHTY
jgi:hypothetical protein